MRLDTIALAIRSKNAGPCLLTLDIIMPDMASFNALAGRTDALRAHVARHYRKAADDVRIFAHAPSRAVKVTMPRDRVAGSVGDTDVYGAQQHAPLLEFEL